MTPAASWPPERLGAVAFRLGVVQAGFAADPPTEPWLSRGWLRSYLELRRPLIEAGGTEARALAGDAAATLARLDAAPQMLCHHDFHPGNVLGDAVIDWAYCGLAALGLDAGVLVADALLDGFLAPDLGRRAERAVWDG